jgi:drug/metabolite transporter (DMT)-like permease
MPPGVIAIVLFSAILHAAWNALLRQSTDRNWTVGWIGVSTCIVCAPFLPFVGWPHGVWPNILASAALHVVYLGLLARAYKVNELSFAYPIARGTSPMLVAIGAAIAASERPGIFQALGIVAIVGGIVTIGLESKHWDKTGFQLAIATGTVVAIYSVIDGIGARKSGLPTQYNIWCFSIYGLAVLIVQLSIYGRKAFHGRPTDIGIAFGGGVTSVVAYAIITWAMVSTPLGVVSALRETSTLFAAAIGLFFLKERFSLQKVAGCAAIVIGAVMIAVK